MAGHHDKDVEYVGDSRIKRNQSPNIPKDYAEFPGKNELFLPDFLLKEWMVAAVVLVGFMILTIVRPAPLEELADPTNTSYIPFPDWYFLFLYQFLKLKYAAGDWVLLGTVIVPGLAFGGLMLAPWLDRGPERRFYKRPIASTLMFLSIISVFYLTWAAVDEKMAKSYEVPKVSIVDPENEAYGIYQNSSCVQCHATNLKGQPGLAPPLLGVGDKYDREALITIMKEGQGGMPGGMWEASIAKGLTEEDMNKLADWLAAQKAEATEGKGGDKKGEDKGSE